MIRKFVVSFLALANATARSASAAPFIPKSHATLHALKLRGGGGPIEAVTAAKILGAVALANGSVFGLSDKLCAKAYGLNEDELSTTDARCVTNHNLSILSTGLIIYCLLFRDDISFNLAMGLGNLPWAMRSLGDLLNKVSETSGPSDLGSMVTLVFCGLAAYAGLTSAEWAGSAFKAAAVYGLVCGLTILLAPAQASELWELKDTTWMTNGMVSGVGFSLTGLGAFLAFLAWGDDIITACGKKAAVDALCLVKVLFFDPDWAKVVVKKEPVYGWLVFFAFVVYSIMA
ncbi:hypothetical protein ACHAWC_005964 [Mediolabrus comicus]